MTEAERWQLQTGVVLCALLVACGSKPEPCTAPGTTRCSGHEAQLCDPEGRWVTTTDCDQVEPGAWSCQWAEEVEGHTCLPAKESTP